MPLKMPLPPFTSSICQSCRRRCPQFRRPFSAFSSQSADGMEAFRDALESSRRPAQQERPAAETPRVSTLAEVARIADRAHTEAALKPSSMSSIDEPYHLHVYAHKHNTHITWTDQNRNPIISLSAGNIGLKKAQRGSFDAAYQLAVFTFTKMVEKQWRTGGKKSTAKPQTLRDVEKIEVLMRGYGPGREAFQKALLGSEGRLIKHKVSRVTDGTRLKFGGVRSKNVRRL